MIRLPNHRQTVAITTLGCKVNQCESASFEAAFAGHGLAIGSFTEPADIYVINSCAVTARAAAQSRQLVRRARRLNPEAQVVVTGCYAQVAAAELEKLDGCRPCIIDNSHKERLVEIVLSRTGADNRENESCLADIMAEHAFCHLPVARLQGRTRAMLKIQDGCNNYCSYCIVPLARGRSRSLAPAAVLSDLETLLAEGCREIVLTGIHAGDYGRDLEPATSLARLLPELAGRAGRTRIRISSLEPTEISDVLLEIVSITENIMPHFHIPLQSGDDDILRAMRRRYTTADFQDIVDKIRRAMPAAAIGVDVMVGFPGEQEAHFANTYRMLEDLPVSYMHVFPYSKRPGTKAAVMPGQVPREIKSARVALLRQLDADKRRIFAGLQLGSDEEILVEGRRTAGGILHGFSKNYLPVNFAGPGSAVNQVVGVRIERLEDRGVWGTMLP